MSRRVLLTVLAVVGVVLLAVGFRFYDIQSYPPGLFPDEAANGEDALLILDGDWRPFYPRGNGREALFFFLEALSIKFFGIGVWQLHIVSAAIGVLTVVATYFATRVWFGRLAGILAALFLATNHWHVTLSRTGFRAILIPLFVAAFSAFIGYTVQAVRRGKLSTSYVYAALAGAAFMGGFYTYIAYRVMAGVVLGIVVLLLLAALHPNIGFPHLKRYWRQLVIGIIAGIIVFLPLGIYFAQNPQDFIGRAGQVSVFNRELQKEFGGGTLLGTIMFSTQETLLSFFSGDGDLIWRHNVVGYPLLNPLVGILFLLGLAWVIRGIGVIVREIVQGQEIHLEMVYPYILLLLLGMLLPIITTAEGIPHGLRSIGLVFPIFFLAGTAGAVVLHWAQRRVRSESARAISFGVLIGLVLLGVSYDGSLYFLMARNDSEAAYDYRADLTEVAQFIDEHTARHPDNPPPYLVLDKFSLQTIHFLLSVSAHEYVKKGQEHPDAAEHRYLEVDPATSHLTVLQPGEIMVFTQSTLPDADRYGRTHDNVELLESRHNKFGQEIMRVYKGSELPADGQGEESDQGFNLDA